MAKYTVEIGGSSWSRGPRLTAETVHEARLLAEDYGTTADYCHVYSGRGRSVGRLVVSYYRDTSGDGTNWFRGGSI